jgi:hypothetical protein
LPQIDNPVKKFVQTWFRLPRRLVRQERIMLLGLAVLFAIFAAYLRVVVGMFEG